MARHQTPKNAELFRILPQKGDAMSRTKKGTPPSYRQHSSGQAIVTVRTAEGNRRDLLLGPWDSSESRAEYAHVLEVLNAHGGRYPGEAPAPESLSVNEVILEFWKYAEGHYGINNKELEQFRYSLRPLKTLYGTHPAARFTPKCLKVVRQNMVDLGWCRSVINRRLTRIKTMFNWAVSEELVPPSIAHGLREVKGFRKGEKNVRESNPVQPAFAEDMLAALPHCPRPVAAMLELQWLTGMRSGEVRVMRTLDIDQANPDCWLYRPGSDAGPHGQHKNAWRGQDRVVPLGPRCIEILKPWLRPDDPAAYLFQPRIATEDRNAKRKALRKTPRTPSQLARKRKKHPKRAPGDCYSEETYPRAVARACKKASVRFHPYMLRHGRKMDIERAEGSEAARCVLGQKSIQSTEHYGKIDVGCAAEVMGRLG
jgi:integrase